MSAQAFHPYGSKEFQLTKALSTVSNKNDTTSQKGKSVPKTRVVANNFRGRPLDKLTKEHYSPEQKPFDTVYGDSFKNALPSASQGGENKNLLSPRQDPPKNETHTTQGDVHIVNLPQPNLQTSPTKLEQDFKSHTGQSFKSEFYTIDGQPIPLPDKDSFGGRAFGSIPYIQGEEAKYYEDMRGLVYKLKYKGPRGSVYQKDFIEHPVDSQGPLWKNDFYTTFQNTKQVNVNTTNRTDFKAYSVGPVKRENMDRRPITQGIPFGGRTSYKVDFIDYGSNTAALYKVKQIPTVIAELPFLSKTTYREGFAKPEGAEKAEMVKTDIFGKKSPLSPSIPFLGESMAMKTYKPFKVEPKNYEKKREEYVPTLSHSGLFNSTYKNDFGRQAGEVHDPRKFMIPKFSFL